MNDRRLRIYLDDHLALLTGETELAARSQRSNRGSPLGDFLRQLRTDLRGQRVLLKDAMRRLGGQPNTVKSGAAWLAEKLGRLKLNGSLLTYSPLSRVLELETLAAAAQSRSALWDSLDAAARREPRLSGIDFAASREQAERHLEELIRRRRYAAVEAFADG
jgi:hypothetical protein